MIDDTKDSVENPMHSSEYHRIMREREERYEWYARLGMLLCCVVSVVVATCAFLM